MIKANELRIGNYIESVINIGGSEVEKFRFDNNIFIVKKEFFALDNDKYFRGILLSKEWLSKFGVVIEILYDEFGSEIVNIISKYFHVFFSGTKILYVHQLQNIVFALTDRELTIQK